jgi:hypothetical protein
MRIHVLPGDAQADTFNETGIEGSVVVCRECLIEGPVRASDPDEFWRARAEFLNVDFADYSTKTVAEFEKLENLAPGAEVNLWFEYELFCQANMWFCLSLLRNTPAEIYRVEPVVREDIDRWKGFGGLSAADLEKCFAARTKFEVSDMLLGAGLWDAYRNGEHQRLRELSDTKSECFHYLKEVCDAEIEKDLRPKQVLKEIRASGLTQLSDIFPVFAERAGVYGYGDSQVNRILEDT